MDKYEFKLNYYFMKYKNTPIVCRGGFRNKFKKENGEFQYLSELILMIEKYQIEKYGEPLIDDTFLVSPYRVSLSKCETARKNKRFGTKGEREWRKRNSKNY